MHARPPDKAAVRIRLTHVALTGRGAAGGDAVGLLEGGDKRVFVPGWLPCGDCKLCGRALPARCPAGQVLPAIARAAGSDRGEGADRVEASERYLTPVDETSGAAGLASEHVALAGLVAEALDAAYRAGLGPEATAVWLGGGALASAGAFWSARRGCRAFHLAARAAGESGGAAVLDPAAGPAAWQEAIASAEAAAGGAPERRIFVVGRSRPLIEAALALALPGSTLSLLDGAPGTMTGLDRLAAVRILVGPSGYHPDLVTESLAAIRRGDVDPAMLARPVGPDSAPAAADARRAALDGRIPVVTLAPLSG